MFTGVRKDGSAATKDLLSPQGQWKGGRKAHCKWSATELSMRLGNWIWRRGGRIYIWRSPSCFSCLSASGLVSGFSGSSYRSLQLGQRCEGGHDKGCQRSRVFSWSTWILGFIPISVKNFVGILIGIVLNLQNDFGLVIIFTILILPTFECGTSFHFSRIFLIVLLQKIEVFIVEIVHVCGLFQNVLLSFRILTIHGN